MAVEPTEREGFRLRGFEALSGMGPRVRRLSCPVEVSAFRWCLRRRSASKMRPPRRWPSSWPVRLRTLGDSLRSPRRISTSVHSVECPSREPAPFSSSTTISSRSNSSHRWAQAGLQMSTQRPLEPRQRKSSSPTWNRTPSEEPLEQMPQRHQTVQLPEPPSLCPCSELVKIRCRRSSVQSREF